MLLDIETAPLVVYCWGLFDQNISHKHIVSPGYVLCWSAKWYGSDDIMFDSVHESTPKRMLQGVHKLLTEADCVVHYNGKKFDIPTLNREFVVYGLPPPAPYKQIDLYLVVRSTFRFPSNKLDYVLKELKMPGKMEHDGMPVWTGCMSGDPKAWAVMKEYNIIDTQRLVELYEKIRPWVKQHPNHGLYDEPGLPVCTNCGSGNLERRGYAHTMVAKYARYRCKDCHSWSREVHNELPKEDRQLIMRRDNG